MLPKKQYKYFPLRQRATIAYDFHQEPLENRRDQKREYSTMATKTLPMSSKRAWKLLTSEEGMVKWLRPFSTFPWKAGQCFEVDGGIFGEIRTLKPGVRARLTWQEAHWEKPSVIQINLVPQKGEKCVLVIHHEKIPSVSLKSKLRNQWKEALSSLKEAL